MESLRENKNLMYSIMISTAVILCLALGISEQILEMFEIVNFADDVSLK